MRKSFVIFSILLCLTHTCFANIDERVYVNWSSPPYNKILRFPTNSGSICTMEYVAPNLVVTASHCIGDGFDFFIACNSNSNCFQLELIKKGNFPADIRGDWAILNIKDRNFWLTDFFITQKKSSGGVVDIAGFGGLKILTDSNIKKLREKLSELSKTSGTASDFSIDIKKVEGRIGIADARKKYWSSDFRYDLKLLMDYITEFSALPEEQGGLGITGIFSDWTNLKVSKGCATSLDSGLVYSTCFGYKGNSGGPFFKGNIIEGVSNQILNDATIVGMESFITAIDTKNFYQAIEEAKQKYPSQ